MFNINKNSSAVAIIKHHYMTNSTILFWIPASNASLLLVLINLLTLSENDYIKILHILAVQTPGVQTHKLFNFQTNAFLIQMLTLDVFIYTTAWKKIIQDCISFNNDRFLNLLSVNLRVNTCLYNSCCSLFVFKIQNPLNLLWVS